MGPSLAAARHETAASPTVLILSSLAYDSTLFEASQASACDHVAYVFVRAACKASVTTTIELWSNTIRANFDGSTQVIAFEGYRNFCF
jgi:hypothetical protein